MAKLSITSSDVSMVLARRDKSLEKEFILKGKAVIRHVEVGEALVELVPGSNEDGEALFEKGVLKVRLPVYSIADVTDERWISCKSIDLDIELPDHLFPQGTTNLSSLRGLHKFRNFELRWNLKK